MAVFEPEQREHWHDLHLLIDDYFTHYNGYIFRGQADTSWPLESSLTRAIRRSCPDEANIELTVRWHLAAFKENIRGRCSVDLHTATDETLWALGQHFGLYTPLLDWSASPYVALFFSLFGECTSGRRCLWALLESDVFDWAGQSGDIGKLKVVRPMSHDNPRLVNQRGLFLDVPVGRAVDAIVKDAPESESVTLYKIDYPDAIRNDILAALNNMNINYASLFPDLVGSSLHANFQLEIESHLEEGRIRGFKGDEF
ncbi:FRG domain-containing protein [Methylobacillus sp.]|uniref:FRG domain-containing protein n=1 Tax=Methylobacillus sp. TaxID=56818 RepID=UPI0012CE7C45|nr:FRG domain-containing protein [Methylobacillus sp.]MPS48838.1 FRG domain-containing protein [Methylobacillus sp.]